ncbi:YncE family protein [Rhodococcus qingshengii]|uniref:YncE family protein n=1 Tax=Rhodococcus qingshengii TaxID=334542 RepID=UPI003AFB0670
MVTNAVTATVSVGDWPEGTAITPDGSRAYAVNARSDAVSVIEAVSNTVVRTLSVGGYSVAVEVTPDGKNVYVSACALDPNAVVIDTATNLVSRKITTGVRPGYMAISPDGARLYVTSIDSSTSAKVLVVDTPSNSVVETISVPWAVGPDGGCLPTARVSMSRSRAFRARCRSSTPVPMR